MKKIKLNIILPMNEYLQYDRNHRIWHFLEIACFLLVISSVAIPWLYLEYIMKISGFADNPLNQDAMMVFPVLAAIGLGIKLFCISIIASLIVAFFGLKQKKILLLLVHFNLLLTVAFPSIILRTFPKQFESIINTATFDYAFMILFMQAFIIAPLLAFFFRFYSIFMNRYGIK